jgi:hypothetical protein
LNEIVRDVLESVGRELIGNSIAASSEFAELHWRLRALMECLSAAGTRAASLRQVFRD